MQSAARANGGRLLCSSKKMIGKTFARFGAGVNKIGDFDDGTRFATHNQWIGNDSVWFDRFVGFRSVIAMRLEDTPPARKKYHRTHWSIGS